MFAVRSAQCELTLEILAPKTVIIGAEVFPRLNAARFCREKAFNCNYNWKQLKLPDTTTA